MDTYITDTFQRLSTHTMRHPNIGSSSPIGLYDSIRNLQLIKRGYPFAKGQSLSVG